MLIFSLHSIDLSDHKINRLKNHYLLFYSLFPQKLNTFNYSEVVSEFYIRCTVIICCENF